jgi:predicted amidophosphoribosyltransferase
MNVQTICPCCSSPLLHHLDHHREYWFCRHCWQEMPDFEHIKANNFRKTFRNISLSTGLKVFS